MTTLMPIRVIDFFESVMEHPHLYTIGGSYYEAVAYIEGCVNAYSKISELRELSQHYFFEDIKIYQLFIEWLAGKLNMEPKDALGEIGNTSDNAFASILRLYREFKVELSFPVHP